MTNTLPTLSAVLSKLLHSPSPTATLFCGVLWSLSGGVDSQSRGSGGASTPKPRALLAPAFGPGGASHESIVLIIAKTCLGRVVWLSFLSLSGPFLRLFIFSLVRV